MIFRKRGRCEADGVSGKEMVDRESRRRVVPVFILSINP